MAEKLQISTGLRLVKGGFIFNSGTEKGLLKFKFILGTILTFALFLCASLDAMWPGLAAFFSLIGLFLIKRETRINIEDKTRTESLSFLGAKMKKNHVFKEFISFELRRNSARPSGPKVYSLCFNLDHKENIVIERNTDYKELKGLAIDLAAATNTKLMLITRGGPKEIPVDDYRKTSLDSTEDILI